MSLSHRDTEEEKISSPLHDAALRGNFDEVQELKNSDPEFLKMLVMRDHNQDLPLDRAAARGHFAIVELLVNAHKINNLPYTINERNYTPLLAAVRWYCKVLDGTYNENGQDGIFNIGKTKDKDYINIIKLLMKEKEFEKHIHHYDNKPLYALHYVIMHLDNEFTKNNQTNIKALIHLMTVLLENGMTSTYSAENQSPRSWLTQPKGPKTNDPRILKELNEIESKINLSKQMVPLNNTNTKAPSQTNAHNKSKKNKKTSPEIDLTQFLDEIEFVSTLKTEPSKKMNDVEFEKPIHRTSSDTPVRERSKPKKNKKRLVVVPQEITPIPEVLSLTKQECQQLATDIFDEFKNNVNYRSTGVKDDLRCKDIIQKIVQLLQQDNENLIKRFQQDKGKLVSELSMALRLNSITTGFLCCRKTKHWIEFNEQDFSNKLLNDSLKKTL